MVLSSTSQSGEGQHLPTVRASLRLSTSRQSLTGGVLGGTSQRRLGSSPSSNARISSPGMLGGNGGGGGGGAVASPTSGGGGGGGGVGGGSSSSGYGEMQRLPMVSEAGFGGEKSITRPPPSVTLRRASTVASMNLSQIPQEASPKDRDRDRDVPLGENVYTLRKERNALRMDKNVLLLNKRRLEGLLRKLLEQPLQQPEEEEMGQETMGAFPHYHQQEQPAGGGEESVNLGSPKVLGFSASRRTQVLKALDESISLEKQLMAGPGGAASAFEAEIARSLDLSEKMSEMQAAHEISISRLEGELSYRRTQAAAATANLQKQLNEAQEELGRLKGQLAGAEAQVRELTQQGADLRKQTHSLNSALAEKSKTLAETRDMLDMDKSTLATIIEMLKEQLRDASADRAAKNRIISELEYAIVHRDALLTEAHDRMNQAAAQAAAAAAAGVSSSAAVARVAASMQAPLDAKG
ncbi:hypothetical protein Vretimale_17376, partial [Volvox reticuliferus]